MKFHIHPVTGVPSRCKAEVGNCPFGSLKEHYSTIEDARVGYEKIMEDKTFHNMGMENNNKSIYSSEEFYSNVKEGSAELIKIQLDKFGETNPDIKTFLNKALKDINKVKNFDDLIRLSSLYFSSNKDFENEGRHDVAATSYFLYKIINYAIIDDGKISKDKTNFLLQLKLDKPIEKPKNSDYLALGHEINIVSFDGKKETLRNLLSNVENVYVGRIKEEVDFKVREIIENNGKELTELIMNNVKATNGKKYFGVERNQEVNSEDFKLIGSGMENNAYLHIPTRMVYKIPHNETVLKNKKNVSTAILDISKAYEELDKEKIKDLGFEYVPTRFINIETNDDLKVKVPMIVQPYLDPEIYIPFEPYHKTEMELWDLGLSDLHDGNVFLNTITRKAVLFDCLFNAGRD